ncbi:MAG: hypothetical protein ACI4I9_07870 [Porcipelethomonas sp.]
MFIVFLLFCLLYYAAFGGYNPAVEIFLYAVEISGFVLMLFSDICLCRTVPGVNILKISIIVYTLAEIVVMLLELGIFHPEFYDGMLKPFVIAHVVFSVFVMLTFLSLCKGNRTHEIFVIIACVIMIAGILGYRVYISMIFNAAALIFIYSSMLFNLSHEKISIFCNGDKAISKEYKSSFFE